MGNHVKNSEYSEEGTRTSHERNVQLDEDLPAQVPQSDDSNDDLTSSNDD